MGPKQREYPISCQPFDTNHFPPLSTAFLLCPRTHDKEKPKKKKKKNRVLVGRILARRDGNESRLRLDQYTHDLGHCVYGSEVRIGSSREGNDNGSIGEEKEVTEVVDAPQPRTVVVHHRTFRAHEKNGNNGVSPFSFYPSIESTRH